MKGFVIDDLIFQTDEYWKNCSQSLTDMQLYLMLENFYSWVLAATASNPETFQLQAEQWWQQRLEEAEELTLDGRFPESLHVLAKAVSDLDTAGLDTSPYLEIFPNLEWDMDFLANDVMAVADEWFAFQVQFSPERFGLLRPLQILELVSDELEGPEVMMTPLDFVYWWAAWYFCRKERRLDQWWWDVRSKALGRQEVTTTLARIKEVIGGKASAGTFTYGIERSFYADGRNFPYPEYPLDLATKYVGIFV